MKNIFKITFLGLCIFISGYAIINNKAEAAFFDLNLNNLEALANGELSNGKCKGVWHKSCCRCGSTHYTYAEAISGKGCSTSTNCH